MGQSSHNYASLHLPAPPGTSTANPADLEKGGRYTVKTANQTTVFDNNYAEINDSPTTPRRGTEIVPTAHGYDVPKPQNKYLQPPSNTTWGPAQGYETLEVAVAGPRKLLAKLQDSRRLSRIDDTSDEYVNPNLLRRAGDIIGIPVISSRKVSNESTSSSTLPLPRERHSSKGAVMSTHGSYNCLKKIPHQKQQHLPSYENIDHDGFIIGQAPPILSPEDSDVGAMKPKPVPPVKMELKKAAIPSKLFKPTAELKQIQGTNNSKEKKHKFGPLTPTDTEKKSVPLYNQPKPARSQTWTLDSKINVDSKLTTASNYTPIDPTKMDPDNDYEPL